MQVQGDSMAPSLSDRRRIVVCRRRRGNYRLGEVIVFTNPLEHGPTFLVKRIVGISEPMKYGSTMYNVAGDAALSIDSRRLGLVEHDSVVGRVVLPRI